MCVRSLVEYDPEKYFFHIISLLFLRQKYILWSYERRDYEYDSEFYNMLYSNRQIYFNSFASQAYFLRIPFF